MKLSEAMEAIVERIADPEVADLQAEAFDGREERADIAARSRAAGKWARVVLLGAVERGYAGDKITLECQFAAFISLPFRPHPDVHGWKLIADLTGAVVARLRLETDWPDDMAAPLGGIRTQNLYQLADTKAGIARSLVQWTQRVDVDLVPDAADLVDLTTIMHDQKHIVDGAEAPTITTEIDLT